MTPDFVDFSPVDQSLHNILLKKLKNDYTNIFSNKCGNIDILFDFIDKSKLKIHFYSCNSIEGLFIIMVNGKSDFDLIKFAKLFSLPRGLPIIWYINPNSDDKSLNKDSYIDIRGFYPKFSNDSLENGSFDTSILEDAEEIVFYKKYSGFLAHIVAFKHEGNYYWTVCSKKSADFNSRFCKMAKEIVSTFLNKELIMYLADNHIYIGGESMHPLDDEHGYIVKNKSFVCTCIGEGTYIDYKTIKSDTLFNKKIMEYMNLENVHSFCMKYNIPCDSLTKVNGTSKELITFVSTIFEDRDILVNSKVTEILLNLTDNKIVTVIPGTVDHQIIIGDVLEGFVFNILIKGKYLTLKVKLPHYTIRTMFCREFLKSIPLSEVTKESYITNNTLVKINSYVDRWCTKKHKDYFINLAKVAIYLLENKIALNHIDSFDMAMVMSECNFNKYVCNFDKCIFSAIKIIINIILIVGPVGTGKTTYGDKIAKSFDNGIHIDGDKIRSIDDLNITNNLSSERSALTYFDIFNAILNGQTIVVSSGGGIFCNYKGEPDILNIINDAFPKCKINLIVGCTSSVIIKDTLVKDSLEESFVKEIQNISSNVYTYNDSFVEKVVNLRIQCNHWTLTKGQKIKDLIEIIKKVNQRNKDFAFKLLTEISSHMFLLPYIEDIDNNKKFIANVNISTLLSKINDKCDKVDNMFVNQLRIIIYSKIKQQTLHITCKFSETKFEITHELLNKFRENLIGKIINGNIYEVVMASETDVSKKDKKISVIHFESINTFFKDTEFFQDSNVIPHATVTMSDFSKKDSPKIISHFLNDSPSILKLTTTGKDKHTFIFDAKKTTQIDKSIIPNYNISSCNYEIIDFIAIGLKE